MLLVSICSFLNFSKIDLSRVYLKKKKRYKIKNPRTTMLEKLRSQLC